MFDDYDLPFGVSYLRLAMACAGFSSTRAYLEYLYFSWIVEKAIRGMVPLAAGGLSRHPSN